MEKVGLTQLVIGQPAGFTNGGSLRAKTIAFKKVVSSEPACPAQALARLLPIGVLWVGHDGSLAGANPLMLKWLGLSERMARERTFSELFCTAGKGHDLLSAAARREELPVAHTLLRRADGAEMPVAIQLIEDGAVVPGAKWVCFATDLSQERALERHALEVSEWEQQRMGHDLHDDLCQHLTAIKLRAASLSKRLGKRHAQEASEASAITELLEHSLERARRVARGLSPVNLDRRGLRLALRELALQSQRVFRTPVVCRIPPGLVVPKGLAALQLYRICQEAVTNAVKHGRASKITIGLRETAPGLELTVTDNGRGFSARDEEEWGLGLHIMRYRARLIGAELGIRTRRPRGTIVTCVAGPAAFAALSE